MNPLVLSHIYECSIAPKVHIYWLGHGVSPFAHPLK